MWIVTIHAAVVMVVCRSWSCSFCIGPDFFTRSFQGPVQFTKAKAAWLKRIVLVMLSDCPYRFC